MKMKLSGMINATAASLAFALGGPALASSVTWYLPGDDAYLSQADSPILGADANADNFWLEDFEDGLVNTLGLEALSDGTIREPGSSTDSVDGDDGSVDGWGTAGHSYFQYDPAAGPSITFAFDAEALGGLPTVAGLVWTDGNPEAPVTFEAFGADGASLGSFQAVLGDGLHSGSTDADRFLGVEFAEGISAITISAAFGGLEIDHVQYGYPIVVPLPAPLAMGLAGLGIVAVARRQRRTG
ncbi:MAG: hypothetical protein JSV91_14010 [Phycisphaerales bacterium]|nr:MAG: hypothetical protein JSV91_14010 [Phycisphaerales bacterium]